MKKEEGDVKVGTGPVSYTAWGGGNGMGVLGAGGEGKLTKKDGVARSHGKRKNETGKWKQKR